MTGEFYAHRPFTALCRRTWLHRIGDPAPAEAKPAEPTQAQKARAGGCKPEAAAIRSLKRRRPRVSRAFGFAVQGRGHHPQWTLAAAL